jgi:hypothetical protein
MTDQESLPQRIRTFLLEPDTFFRQLAEKPAQYRWPLVIALVTGLCAAVATWLMTDWMMSFFIAGNTGTGMEAGVYKSVFGVIAIIASVSEFFSPFVILLVAGLGFYFLAGFVSKGGSLSHSVTAAGWGMIPLFVYEALRIPLILALLPGMSITVAPEFFIQLENSSSASSMDSAAMAHMITPNPAFYTFSLANAGLHVLAFLCCAWFWIPAVHNTGNVSHRHATMIVLIPLLLYLAVSFGPVFMTGGHGL